MEVRLKKYPYNSLPVDNKMWCCLGCFPKRLHPYSILGYILLFDGLFWGIIALGSFQVVFQRWWNVLSMLFGIYQAVYSLILYKNLLRYYDDNLLRRKIKVWFVIRLIVLLVYLIGVIAMIAWSYNQLEHAYSEMLKAPMLTHEEFIRQKKGYIGTYWQEISSKSAYIAIQCCFFLINVVYLLVLGCTGYEAYTLLERQKERKLKEIEMKDLEIGNDGNL